MPQPHLAYPDLAPAKLSGTDPDQDAEAFIRLIECKINFSLRTEQDPGDLEHAIYLIRKKSFILLATTRTRSRKVWEHVSRCNDLN